MLCPNSDLEHLTKRRCRAGTLIEIMRVLWIVTLSFIVKNICRGNCNENVGEIFLFI
jgi:hypothetical protein